MTKSAVFRPVAAVATAASLACSVPLFAAPLKTDAGKSAVSAVFKQMNVPIEAKFTRFSAQIDFDSAKPAKSKASIDIDVPSFDLGDPDYNREVLKKEWFNAAQFPKANFTSGAIRPAGDGRFDVAGKLTIKGRTADVQFPLVVRKQGAQQVFEGTLPIRRLAFGVGEGEWRDTGIVADEVQIKFRFVAGQ